MVASAKKMLNALAEKGVSELYHANSVLTACEYLQHGALFSRGSIEGLGLRQTSQYSDAADKRYHLWNDVFMDSVDIHRRASRMNQYGPVMFVLDTERLANEMLGEVWITKLNPTKWAGKTNRQKWFTSVEEFEEGFDINSFDHMIVFRHSGGRVPIKNSLKKIFLDDPEYATDPGEIDLFSYAFGALKHAMYLGPKTLKIRRRQCEDGCACLENYAADMDKTLMMYRPFLQKGR